MTAVSGAGYSGTPLLKKLGVRDGSTLTLVGAPDGVIDVPPASVTVRRQARGSSDVVVAFFTRRQDLERRMEALSRVIYPDGSLWIAWPKRSSGVETTVNEDVVPRGGLTTRAGRQQGVRHRRDVVGASDCLAAGAAALNGVRPRQKKASRDNGQTRKSTFPTIVDSATGPQYRLSQDSIRLSPMT